MAQAFRIGFNRFSIWQRSLFVANTGPALHESSVVTVALLSYSRCYAFLG